MVVVRSLAFNILFYIATALIALVGLPVLVSQRATLRYAQFWGHVSIWLLRVVAGTRVDFRGIADLPKGPLVIAAKHQSTLETLALTIPFEKFTYVLKRELMWIPLFGWYLGRSGMVPIDRAKGARTMAKLNAAAAQAIREGRQLIIFPEGTRRAAGASPAYKQGLSHLYVALGVPCVPVALNSGLYWRRHSFWRLPGTCVIEFLAPNSSRARPAGVSDRGAGADRDGLERAVGRGTGGSGGARVAGAGFRRDRAGIGGGLSYSRFIASLRLRRRRGALSHRVGFRQLSRPSRSA